MRLELSLDDIKPDSWSHIANGDKKVVFGDLTRLAQAAVIIVGEGIFHVENIKKNQRILPPEDKAEVSVKT